MRIVFCGVGALGSTAAVLCIGVNNVGGPPGSNFGFSSQFGTFPEYHTSADNLDFIRPRYLAASFHLIVQALEILERDRSMVNLFPKGEPQLGKRGLYQSVPDGTNPEAAYLWLLSLSDGRTDLLSIAERGGMPFEAVRAAARTLAEHDLLERAPSA